MAKSKNNTNPTIIKEYDPCKGRPYNRYNIYYILEREHFLQSFPGYSYKNEQQQQTSSRTSTTTTADSDIDNNCSAITVITGYENLGYLPPLPPRYAELELSHDWYMPGKRKLLKRDHKKTHGVASFQEIARVVADGWRSIDEPTLEYCTAIAKILKQRHVELKKAGGLKCFATGVATAKKRCHSSCESLTKAPLKSAIGCENDDVERLRPSPKKKEKARCHPETTQPSCACPGVSTRVPVRTTGVDFPLTHPPVVSSGRNSPYATTHRYSNTYHHNNDRYTRDYAPSPRRSSPVSSSEGHYHHHHHRHYRRNGYHHPHSLPSSRTSSPIPPSTSTMERHYAAREYANASAPPPSSHSRRSRNIPDMPSAEMDLHDQAILAVCGIKSNVDVGPKILTTTTMARSNSEPVIHSEVDIPDQEIRAMWFT